MIQLRSINITAFIKTWLPQHKRQPNRLSLFGLLLTPFNVLMAEFITWRNAAIAATYVTNQKMALESYLNDLYDPVARSIYITNRQDGGMPMGDRDSEPTLYQVMGDRDTEPTIFATATGPKEDPNIGQYSFAVFIPASLAASADIIQSTVRKYSYAWKPFTIITF